MLLSKVVVVVGEKDFSFASTRGVRAHDGLNGKLVIVYVNKKAESKPVQTMAVFTKWDYWLGTEGTPDTIDTSIDTSQ